MFGLFKRINPAEREKAARFKILVRSRLALGKNDTVSISQIECGDATCPGIETVILVMKKDSPTKAYRLKCPLLDADERMIGDALQQP